MCLQMIGSFKLNNRTVLFETLALLGTLCESSILDIGCSKMIQTFTLSFSIAVLNPQAKTGIGPWPVRNEAAQQEVSGE